jgi:N-acetylglutamate synthase-like GNAT family acetyltransferase
LKAHLNVLVHFIQHEEIRKAALSDVEKIARLYEKSFPEHIMVRRGLLSSPSYISEHIQSDSEVWIVAEKGGEIVGVAALAIAPPIGLGEIERVCVGREHRGHGTAYEICSALVDEARRRGLGFVEAFARGDQPPMQRTFEKLGFMVYGVAPRFEVMHGDRVVREQFVHLGKEIKPETVDESGMRLIPAAQRIYDTVHGRDVS